MIKKITLIAAWIFTASIFNISAQDVSVSVDVPASAAPETTFRITLTVTKGDISGFAKLEQILPAGLEATSVDVANSTFSFKDRKAKFLWMSLPAEPTFKVSYDVKVASGTSGNQILEGTFAYILNNETQKYTLPKGIINISATDVANTEIKTNVVETEHNNAEAEKAKADAAEKARADADAKAQQSANQSAEEKAKQDVADAEKANKELAESIKRKQEEEKKNADAIAKKQQQEASQLEKKQQQEASQLEKKQAVKSEVAVKEGKPVNGLVFRAQVAAGKKKVSPSVFQDEFKITDEIFWEDHDGWNKYTVGNFSSYRAAKTFANDIRDNNGVAGSFVVAYNNGTRISVQEALNLAGGK